MVHKSLGEIKSDWARRAVLQLAWDENRPIFVCDLSFEKNASPLGKIIAATAVSLGRDVGFIDLSRVLSDVERDLTPDIEGALAKVGNPAGGTEYVYPAGRQTWICFTLNQSIKSPTLSSKSTTW
jgi:hypothetical protein